MKNHSASTNRLVIFALWCGMLVLSSCKTYQYGYWGKLPDQAAISHTALSSPNETLEELAREKRQLTAESFALSGEIKEKFHHTEPVPMRTFNLLFDNLHNHYQIDTVYHLLMQKSTDDSIRKQMKQALLESAIGYKKAFQKDKFIRRTINRGDQAYGLPANTLTKTQQFLWSDKTNRRYLVAQEKDDKEAVHTKVGYFISKEVDNCHAMQYKTVYFLSMIFGRFAGQFHGHIDKKTNAMLLKSYLQEFDIVFLKSLTHLTEKFIPGYFGHVGVCMGNDLMIEAPRSGVRICSTEDFAEGEIYLIIRPGNLTETEKQKIRRLLKSQIGKEYDYNFDSQSPDRVVCSELVSLSYDFINWQSKKIAGRYTTSPDDLIRSLMNRADFEFELYLNQGRFISHPDSNLISELLKKK